MHRVVEAQPTVLYDHKLNKIEDPDELKSGYHFYISQKEPLASGESMRNPFDVGPVHFDIPDIQHSGLPDADLLLVRVEKVPAGKTAFCRVEAEVDTDEVGWRSEYPGETLLDGDVEIHTDQMSEDDIRGSMNELAKRRP